MTTQAPSVDVVILGAGHWHADWHLRSLQNYGVRVVGVWDESSDVAERTVRQHGGKAWPTWREAVAGSPDAVVLVLVPHDRGAEVLEELVISKRPFVLEKPGTLSGHDLDEVIGMAGGDPLPAHRVLLVNRRNGFWSRWRDLEARGAEWRHARFTILAGPPTRYEVDGVGWVLDEARSGGGVLRNLGVHVTDAAVALARGPLAVVAASATRDLFGYPVDDHAEAMLETIDGRTIGIEAGYATPNGSSSQKEWRVHSSSGMVIERGRELIVASPDATERLAVGGADEHYGVAAGEAVVAVASSAPIGRHEADLYDLRDAQLLVDQIYRASAQRIHPR